MANVFIDEAVMQALAALLREFTESETKYYPANMPPAFRTLLEEGASAPEGVVLKALEVVQNGVFVPESGVHGFNMVTVNVPASGEIEDGIIVTSTDANGNWVEVIVYGELPASALQGNTVLKKVVLANATSIPANAFDGCSALTAVTFPASVTSIGNYAFRNCTNLASIVIPDTVKSIGTYAFYGCTKLTDITWPSTVTKISDYAFYNCTSLTTFNLPTTATAIGNYTFYGCTGLANLDFPATVTAIGNYAFNGCNGFVTLSIPGTVKSIGNYAFYRCLGLTTVEIADGVTTIGTQAFEGCTKLTSIVIPDTVTSLGKSSFYGCTALTSAKLSSGLTTITEYLFYGCTKLTTIDIPEGVTSVQQYAFRGCTALEVLTLPSTLLTVANDAFHTLSALKSLTIPANVTSLGAAAFYACGITELNWNAVACTASGTSSWPAFGTSNSLATLNIADDVTTLPSYMVENCTGLTSVVIPDSVKTINTRAFNKCSGLTSVQIGTSADCEATVIGTNAFGSCSALTDIFIYRTADAALGSPWGATSATIHWLGERQLVYNWDFTQSLVDTVAGKTAVLAHTNNGTPPAQSEVGVVFDAAMQYLDLGAVFFVGRTIEIDVAEFDFQGVTSAHIRFVNHHKSGHTSLCWRSNSGWAMYNGSWSSVYNSALSGSSTDVINYFNGKTVTLAYDSAGYPTLYVDGESLGKCSRTMSAYDGAIYIGACPGTTGNTQSQGNQCYNMTITGIRIYKE